jgi:hypothetical protein
VAGVVVFLTIASYQVFYLINRLYMMSEGKEFATLLGVVPLASAFYCFEFVYQRLMFNL